MGFMNLPSGEDIHEIYEELESDRKKLRKADNE